MPLMQVFELHCPLEVQGWPLGRGASQIPFVQRAELHWPPVLHGCPLARGASQMPLVQRRDAHWLCEVQGAPVGPFDCGTTNGRLLESSWETNQFQRRGCMMITVGEKNREVWMALICPTSFE